MYSLVKVYNPLLLGYHVQFSKSLQSSRPRRKRLYRYTKDILGREGGGDPGEAAQPC